MSFSFPTLNSSPFRRNIETKNLSARTGTGNKVTSSNTAGVQDSITLVETDAVENPPSGLSRIWIRNDNPNVPVITASDGTSQDFGAANPYSLILAENDTADLPPAGYADVLFNSSQVFVTRGETGGEIQFDTSQPNSVCIGLDNVAGPNCTIIGLNNNAGSGDANILIGNNCGDTTTFTGNDNVVIGVSSGTAIGAGNENVLIGYNAQVAADKSFGIAIGYYAAVTNDGGIAIGSTAEASKYGVSLGVSSTSGNYSVAIGKGATASDANSVALGSYATATFDNTVVIGKSASNTAAANSVVIGISSSNSGAKSCVIGNLSNCTAAGGTVLGYKNRCSGTEGVCLDTSRTYTTAAAKTVIVGRTYVGGSTGSVRLGGNWGWIGSSNANPGSGSIVIGSHNTGGSDSVVGGYSIGNSATTNSIAFGQSTTGTLTNRIDFFSISTLNCQVALTVTSDGRFKNNIVNVPDSLALIDDLHPVYYKFNNAALETFNPGKMRRAADIANDPDPDRKAVLLAELSEEQPDTSTHVGLVAQDVRDAFVAHNLDPALVVNIPVDENTELYGVNYESLIPFLVKSVQELTVRYRDLRAQAEALAVV